jgi:hypothetical protein
MFRRCTRRLTGAIVSKGPAAATVVGSPRRAPAPAAPASVDDVAGCLRTVCTANTWVASALRDMQVTADHVTEVDGVVACPFVPTTNEEIVIAAVALSETVMRSRGMSTAMAIRHEITFSVPHVDVAGMSCVVAVKCDEERRKNEAWLRFSVRCAGTRRVVAAGTVACVAV